MRLKLIWIWMRGGEEPLDRTEKNDFGRRNFFMFFALKNIEFVANKVLSHRLTLQTNILISVPNNPCCIQHT